MNTMKTLFENYDSVQGWFSSTSAVLLDQLVLWNKMLRCKVLVDSFASDGSTIYSVCKPKPCNLLSDIFDSFGQSGVGVVRLVVPGAEDILCADQGPGNRGLHEGTKAAKRCSAPSFCLQQVLSSVHQG